MDITIDRAGLRRSHVRAKLRPSLMRARARNRNAGKLTFVLVLAQFFGTLPYRFRKQELDYITPALLFP